MYKMACGSCSKKRAARKVTVPKKDEVMGGYGYLTDRQIKARLEVYKKKYCKDCNKRYECDYKMYVECKKSK
jgi:hypothetical protein